MFHHKSIRTFEEHFDGANGIEFLFHVVIDVQLPLSEVVIWIIPTIKKMKCVGFCFFSRDIISVAYVVTYSKIPWEPRYIYSSFLLPGIHCRTCLCPMAAQYRNLQASNGCLVLPLGNWDHRDWAEISTIRKSKTDNR